MSEEHPDGSTWGWGMLSVAGVFVQGYHCLNAPWAKVVVSTARTSVVVAVSRWCVVVGVEGVEGVEGVVGVVGEVGEVVKAVSRS